MIAYTGGLKLIDFGLAKWTSKLAQTATGPDYSTLTSAVDFDTTITAVLAIGALAVGLALVTVGIRKTLRMVRSA